MAIKIGETIGRETVGYGESRIKWYGGDEGTCHSGNGMALYVGGKKCAELLFDDVPQMLQVQLALGSRFRVIPAKRSRGGK